MALPTLSEFASQNPSDDPLDLYKRYSDYTKTELLKAGEWDDELVDSIDANLIGKAQVEGIDLGPDPFATLHNRATDEAKVRDLRQLEADADERKDPVATTAIRDYAGMLSPQVKQSYTDSVAYNTKLQQLEEAAAPYLSDTEAINRARRRAVERGETPVAVVKRGDNMDVELSPALMSYVGDDQGLGMLLENHPEVPRSLIPQIRQKLAVPEGYKAPIMAFERQADFFAAAEKDYGAPAAEAAQAMSEGDFGKMDGIVNSAVFGLKNNFGTQFSENELRGYFTDMVKQRANPDLGGQNPLLELSTGQIVAPLNLAFDKEKFNAAIDAAQIPEVQKTRLREDRVAQLDTAAPSIFGVIAGYDLNFVPFKEKMVREGKSNAEILDTWNANPERKTANDVYLSQTGAGIKDAILGIPLGLAALSGSDTAKNIMVQHMKEDGARRAYSQLMGRNTGIGYDLLSVAPQLGADIAIAVGTGGAGAELAATRVTAKSALKLALKDMLGAEAKSLAKSYMRNIAGDVTADQVYKLAARDMAAYLTPKLTEAAFLGTAFTRSAGSAYASISSALEAKGVPPDQVRSTALGHALIAGTITAAITKGMSLFGHGGMETIFDDLSRPQLNRVFNKAKAEWDNLAPELREGIDMTSANKMLASIMTKAVKPIFSTALHHGASEGVEEGLDQFSQYINEKLATGDKVNLADAAREAGYAALLGGVMGAGIPAIRDTYHGVSGKEAPEVLQHAARTRLFTDTAAKLDKANSPQAAAVMRALANQAPATRSVPEAVSPAGPVAPPSGQAVAGAEAVDLPPNEAASVSQPEQVDYFNYVMGEPEPATPAAPQPKTREQLDAELQGIVSRYKARKGPAIQLEPIELKNPDRIYLEQLPLKNPDRILLEPMDLGDTVLYGRGLSAEGNRILLERIKLTKERGPQAVPPPKPGETRLLAAKPTLESIVTQLGLPMAIEGRKPTLSEVRQNIQNRIDRVQANPQLTAEEKQSGTEGLMKMLGDTEQLMLAAAKPSRAGTRSGLVASADQSQAAPVRSENSFALLAEPVKVSASPTPEQPLQTGRRTGTNHPKGKGGSETKATAYEVTPSAGVGETLPDYLKSLEAFAEAMGAPSAAEPDSSRYEMMKLSYEQALRDAKRTTPTPTTREAQSQVPQAGAPAALEGQSTQPPATGSPEEGAAQRSGEGEEVIDITSALAEPPTPVEVAATSAAPEIALREDPDTLTQAKEFLQSKGFSIEGLRETDVAKFIQEEFTPRQKPETAAKPGQIRSELERHGFSQGLTPFLQSVAKSGEPRYRQMAKLLLGYPELLANTPVSLVDMPNSEYAGVMIPSTGQVVVNEASTGPRGAVDTVIHELLHAATIRALHSPTEAQRKFLGRLDRLRETVSRRAAAAGIPGMEYALGSNDEFITHWFTSPKFQENVGKLTQKGERNLIQVILDAIKQLITGKPVSQIDRSINDLMGDMLTFTKGALDTTWGQSRMDQLMQQDPAYRDLSRMEELQSLTQRTPAQEAELRGLEVRQQPGEAGVASDEDYMDAVSRGDTESAQQMVDAAAKEAGYLMKLFHGTRNRGFTVFDRSKAGSGVVGSNRSRGFYFSDSRDAASWFADATTVEKTSDDEISSDDFLIYGDGPFFILEDQSGLNAGPYNTESEAEQATEAFADKWNSSELGDVIYEDDKVLELFVSYENPIKVSSVRDFREAELSAESEGYDAIIAEDIVDGDTTSTVTVVFNPSQIKSADPITYDSNGNVIPLSQRFNPATPDIRFQPAEAPDHTETLRQADEAGRAALPESEDHQHLTDTLTHVANGLGDLRAPDYRVNPERKSQLITYLKGVVDHLAKAPFDPETATTLDRTARFLAKAKDNFITRPQAPPLDLDELQPRFQMAESPEPFYSALTNVIDAKVQGRSASPEQLKALIDNPSNGVKAEEIKWSGVKNRIDQLATENGGKVPKDALLNWLSDEGAVRFEEVTTGMASRPEIRAENAEDGTPGFSIYDNGEFVEWYETRNEAEANLPNLERSSGGTKYAQYTLPGGENYREVVLAMPETRMSLATATDIAKEAAEASGQDWNEMTDQQRQEAIRDARSIAGEEGEPRVNYTSSHFPDVPNYVAHMRLNERTDAAGKPGLFIEELQSDRHQAGRKKGYSESINATVEPATVNGRDGFMVKSDAAGEEWYPFKDIADRRAADLNARLTSGIADAPYRTAWPLALFKRALRDAVASGKEWIGWTNGETQNDRFDLSKQVDSIDYSKGRPGKHLIIATKDGSEVTRQEVNTEDLPNVVGKDVAQRIVEGGESGTLSGAGLQVGGSGMKGFYDNMLPKEIGKYVKQWGGKVEGTEINQLGPDDSEWEIQREDDGRGGYVWMAYNPNIETTDGSKEFASKKQAQAFVDSMQKGTPIWRIDITPEMAKSVSTQGQPLFQPSESTDPKELTNYVHAWDGYKFASLNPDHPQPGLKGFLKRIFTQENDMRKPWREAKKARDFTLAAAAMQGEAAARPFAEEFQKAIDNGADADKLTSTIGAAIGTTAPMLTEDEALRIHDETDQKLLAAKADFDAKVAAATAERDKVSRSESLRAEKLKKQKAKVRREGKKLVNPTPEEQAAYDALVAEQSTREAALMEARGKLKTLDDTLANLEADHAATVQQIMADDQTARIKSELEFAKKARDIQDLAMQDLTASHPELAKAVGDMRDLLNAFQDEVYNRMGHRPELQMKIDRSRGIYLVRSYRLHQDPSLGQRILHDEKYRELRDRTITFFEQKFADQWVAKVKDAASKTEAQVTEEAGNLRLSAMEKELRKLAAYASYPEYDLRVVAQHEVEQQARHAFEDFIIGRTNLNAEVPGLESIKVDAARFMKKGNVPQEIRDALLENTDPLFNATHTFNALANIVVQHDMLTRFRDAGLKQGWLTDADGVKSNPDRYKGWRPVVTANEGNAAWSNMAGMYAAPEDIAAFHSAFKSGSKRYDTTAAKALGFLNKKLTGAAGLSLGIVTQGNPAYYPRNVFNGLFFMAANGLSPVASAKGLGKLKSTYKMESGNFNFDDMHTLRSTALGLVQGGSVAADVKSLMEQYESDPVGAVDRLNDLIAERWPAAAAGIGKVGEINAKVLEKINNLAAMSEGFATHAIFDDKVKMLTEAKFGTPEEIFREAARRTLRVVPAKSERPQAVTAFTQNGLSALVAPFIGFKSDMVRTTVNLFADAWVDSKSDNPVIKAHGRKVLASASMVVVGLTSVLPMIAAALAGIGDDEDRAIRAALPEFAKNSSFIYWRDPKTPKQFLTFDLTFLNSYSFVVDPFTQGFTSIRRGRFNEIPELVARTFGQEVFGENVVAGAVMDVKRNIDESTKRPIYLDSDTFGDKTYKSLKHVFDSAYNPALVKKAMQFQDSFSRTSKGGENFWYTPQGVLLGAVAPLKPRVNNVDDLNYRAMAKFRNAKSQLWQNTAPLKSPAALSTGEARDIVDKQVDATRRIASEGYELVQGFRKLGMSDREIMQNMVDSGSSERSSKLLMQGYAMRPVLDKESLQKIYALSPERYHAIIDEQNKHAVYLKVSP